MFGEDLPDESERAVKIFAILFVIMGLGSEGLSQNVRLQDGRSCAMTGQFFYERGRYGGLAGGRQSGKPQRKAGLWFTLHSND